MFASSVRRSRHEPHDAPPPRGWCAPATLLLALLLVSACSSPQVFEIGSPAPTFDLPALDGSSLRVEDFAGTPTVVNFWATWCAPCVREMPELEAFAASGATDVIGIALDEAGAEPVRRFVEEVRVSYPIALGNQDVFRSYRGFGVPYTVLLDADLVVRQTYRGPVSRETLARDVEHLYGGP